MEKIPARLKRVSAALDEVPRDSSGSDHSAAPTDDLSVLVDSFLEREYCRSRDGEGNDAIKYDDESVTEIGDRSESGSNHYTEKKEMLMRLIGHVEEGDGVRRVVRSVVEMAMSSCGSGKGFKREVMTSLRQRGFDAGLCKSRWEKTSQHPAGEHEYVDILVFKTRYIIELSFLAEFTIARPTNHYKSLLEPFPQVVVCTEGELKQVVRSMCGAMRESIRKRGMHIPPWRRYGYMLGKWFGSYKRTTNTVPSVTKISYRSDDFNGTSLIGFETKSPAMLHQHCRGKVARTVRYCIGNLKDIIND